MAGVKKRRPSVATVSKWIEKGYGQGIGVDYKPFFFVRDIPSEGSSNMVSSRITGRTHHYLSDPEFSVHLLAEYTRRAVDIREQYALLPWNETQSIAAQLGIRHPVFPSTKTPTVVTTDLLLSLQEPDGVRDIAVSVKSSDALSLRDMEKLLLECVYWQRRGISWVLIFKNRLPQPRTQNLKFFENGIRHNDVSRKGLNPNIAAQSFERNWEIQRTYLEILKATSDDLNINPDDAHMALGAAVWAGASPIDIDISPLSYNAPVVLRK